MAGYMTQDEAYEKYQDELAVIHERFDCDCSQIHAVRRQIADGRIMVYEQCQRCGRSPKSLKKADFDIETMPWFNEKLVEQYDQQRRCAYEVAREKWLSDQETARQDKNTEWWEKYNKYLHSQHWHDMRQKVLERDQHVCQACLRNKATQVHHLSYALYEQLGKSAAFELVSICYSCHRAIHPHLAESQQQLAFFNPYLNGGRNGHN